MKKTFRHIKASILLYSIIYAIYSFAVWRIENPLIWLSNIGNKTIEHRLVILFTWAAIQTCIAVYFAIRDDEKKHKEKTHFDNERSGYNCRHQLTRRDE